MKKFTFIITFAITGCALHAQQKSIINTSNSPYAKLQSLDMQSVHWTNGFWAERFNVCQQSMVPHMMGMYLDDSISHGFANFEIAAGLKEGEHVGPPFHDGDFYKILEAMIVVNGLNPEPETENQIDQIISIIGKTQRADGYIHTPVVIEQNKDTEGKKEFGERLDFETYNMGHLMTAACIHYRLTGKKNLLDIAKKATDFLYNYYQNNQYELAQNAICPSHYMGVTEMYRTLGDPKYLELAKGLVDIRSMVENGTDQNQDRIPFRQQTTAKGHAVRANYLYAGVADVYAETGDDSLFHALDAIWHDLTERKMYVTGACGALYDGVSPNGTTYSPPEIQQVHQAYGQDYELPNLSAHNESCANIGNLLWNWRMLLLTANAKYADVMEQVIYNSLLSGVSLDGTGYFYTNPLAVSQDITYQLRWSKEREPYISYCNCCPPNTIRTIAEIQEYAYSLSDNAIWCNLYGANKLNTILPGGDKLVMEQITNYPWEGTILLTLQDTPKNEFTFHLRIPAWADEANITVNNELIKNEKQGGIYVSISRKWKKGDKIKIELPIQPKLIASNPLVEENRNQVAVQRGPVVYCLESIDFPDAYKLADLAIPANTTFKAVNDTIGNSTMVSLTANVEVINNRNWERRLYAPIEIQEKENVNVKFVPYYAWGNRGKADMSVWLPISW